MPGVAAAAPLLGAASSTTAGPARSSRRAAHSNPAALLMLINRRGSRAHPLWVASGGRWLPERRCPPVSVCNAGAVFPGSCTIRHYPARRVVLARFVHWSSSLFHRRAGARCDLRGGGLPGAPPSVWQRFAPQPRLHLRVCPLSCGMGAPRARRGVARGRGPLRRPHVAARIPDHAVLLRWRSVVRNRVTAFAHRKTGRRQQASPSPRQCGSAAGALAYRSALEHAPAASSSNWPLLGMAASILLMTPLDGIVAFVALPSSSGVPMATVIAIQSMLVSQLTPTRDAG